MDAAELKKGTRPFGLRVINAAEALPSTRIAGVKPMEKLSSLMNEADKIVAILTASIKTDHAHVRSPG